MIKLKSILAEDINESKDYWLDPNGKLHRVGRERHPIFARTYLSNLIAKKKMGVESLEDSYRTMYNLGWVRVALFGYMGQETIHFNLNKGKDISSSQRDTLEQLAKEYNVEEIVDATNGRRYPTFEG